MTETLKTVLHDRADAVHFDLPDLGAIREQGDRTLRRCRAGLAGGVLVAAGAAVVATTLAVASSPEASPDAPIARDPGQVGTVDVSWVEGSTLHRASADDLDLGRRAVAFVRTSVGYVFAGSDGAVFSSVDGDVTQVGSTDPDAVRLLSDPAGPTAVWLDADGTGVVAYDQSSGADLTLEGRFTDAVPVLTALDGDTAYAEVGSQARSIDLVTGETAVVARNGSSVLDASDGTLALGDDSGVRLSTQGRLIQDTVLRDAYGGTGTFSPDGAWFSSDADQPQVVSTQSGEPVTFDVPAYFATGYEWLDATTLVMIAQQAEGAPVELLTCQVPEGTCVTEVELPAFEELEVAGFVGPIGEPMDW